MRKFVRIVNVISALFCLCIAFLFRAYLREKNVVSIIVLLLGIAGVVLLFLLETKKNTTNYLRDKLIFFVVAMMYYVPNLIYLHSPYSFDRGAGSLSWGFFNALSVYGIITSLMGLIAGIRLSRNKEAASV